MIACYDRINNNFVKGVFLLNDYKINLSVEPTNDYDKAQMDIIQAMNSIQKLSPQQREQLATELFGLERIELIRKVLSLISRH